MQPITTPQELIDQGYSKTFADRFWKKVNKSGPTVSESLGPCWEWTGWTRKDKWPYGSISAGSRKTRSIGAHVASWILHYGPVPKGCFVLHKCDFCKCVNPSHLFTGTAKENTQDMIAKGRFNCGNHKGERNGMATITQGIANEIRSAHIPWRVTKKQLAKRFGVSIHIVKSIVNNRNWISG